MHIDPSKNSFSSSRLNDTGPSEEQANFANKDITILPDELLVKIFSNLELGDLAHCQPVNRRWQKIIDDHMLALAFYRRCHRAKQRTNPLTVERYQSSVRGWLAGFSNFGGDLAARLDKFLQHKHFSEILFFSIAKVLAKAKALTCQDVGTITHCDSICNTSFSPDGGYLVTVSLDRTAKVWKLVNDQWQKETTIEHSDWVMDVCFSPDGKRLVTASSDKIAKIWRLEGGQWQEETTIEHSGPVNNVRFSPDGKRLVTASTNTAKIWLLVGDQWQEETTIKHFGRVNDVCFSPDGRYLVTAAHDAKIWELVGDQWQEKATIAHSSMVVRACFSPDGNHLVTIAYKNNTAQIWGFIGGQWRAKANIEYEAYGYEGTSIWIPGWVNDVCFSPDGNYLAIAAADTPTISKFVDGEWEKSAAIEYSSLVSKVSFSPDGNHLLIASEGPTVKIWGGGGGRWQEKATIPNTGSVRSTSFSPDGHHLVIASDSNDAKVWVLKSEDNDDSC